MADHANTPAHDSGKLKQIEWNAALAGLKQAQDAHLAAVDAHGEAQTRYYAAHPDTSQSELEALIAETQSNDARTSGESSAAADAVLACPAPDLAAVARKIEIAQDYGRDASELAPVIADLRRIGGEA